MTLEEVFEIWAPESSPWSPWVAPVIFASLEVPTRNDVPLADWPETGWVSPAEATAVVIDLPGADSVRFGMGLAERDFRPVPLYNASPAPPAAPVAIPDESFSVLQERTTLPYDPSVVGMKGLLEELARATLILKTLAIPPEAPPAFLLDARRLRGERAPMEGLFDNRWMVFPQDFPSARFLKERGIGRALLVQEDSLEPQNDLAHVLLRWQDAGIEVWAKEILRHNDPVPIHVQRPSRFKAAWYRALALLGLRRSSVGGFGSFIPEDSGMG